MSSTLSQAVRNSALGFTSCLRRASSLVNGESLSASKFFPDHAPSLMNVHGLLDSQEHVRTFQSPSGHCSPQIFLLYFLVSQFFFLFFTPTAIYSHSSCNVEKLPLIILNKCLQGKGCLHEASSESDQIKIAWSESSREPPDRSNNDNSLKMRL